jgi:hypothetical protein
MIKVTYETVSDKTDKPEHTSVKIFDGKMFVQYDVPSKAEMTVKQMKQDGRTGVLFSRGMLIQIFRGKTEEEVLQIVLKDIENGLYVAKEKSKIDMKIENIQIKR